MANVNIDMEKGELLQCPECKRIYLDEWTCPVCKCKTTEICSIITDVW